MEKIIHIGENVQLFFIKPPKLSFIPIYVLSGVCCCLFVFEKAV